MAKGYLKGGWREKYFISKQNHDDDGNMTGITFTDPEALYFVMRYDEDPHARVAMESYSDSVRQDNEKFADDIMEKLMRTLDSEGSRLQRDNKAAEIAKKNPNAH